LILDQYGRQFPKQNKIAAELAKIRSNAMSLEAAYDAARTNTDNARHWRYADDLSATAANTYEVRKTLRERARYECLQSNSFGNGIVKTLANDTISTGPSLQVLLGDTVVSRQIESKFAQWAKQVSLYRKLRTARLAQIVDGETFILRVNNPQLRGRVTLDLQLIEADQVSTPGWIEGRPGRVDGIVFDQYNNPTIYHVLKQHPGDMWVLNSFEKEDIYTDDMIHMFRRNRPGQARGIPEVTPALPLFADLRRYTYATIKAAEIAADFAAVIQTAANAYDSTGESVLPFSSTQIDRGMMTALPQGYQMSQFRPEQPTSTYEGFRDAILMEIARCLHMPMNKTLGSSAAYNYSSAKMDDQIYWHDVKITREEWETDCLDRIFDWWLDEAVLIPGYLPLATVEEIPHRWTWPPRESINPIDDANVAISLIKEGLMTEAQYLAMNNIDPDTFYRQMEEQIERRKRWGTVTQEQAMVMQMADQQAQAETEAQAAEPIASGEFMGLSRMQWNRNRKAIMDVLKDYASGSITRNIAQVFLSGVGLSPENVKLLLDDASDGSVDSIPEDESQELTAAARYDHIDFSPPQGVREEAKRGLEWRREFNRGGTEVGVARARDLSNGKNISPDTAKRMKAYFDRHEADKKGEGFSPGEKGFPSAGRIAWALWGGDSGQAWANKLNEQMDAADKREGVNG
jgi:lambda family phage portal protein